MTSAAAGEPDGSPHGAPTRISALLLDLDGTLVNSEPLHREGYRLYFATKGWDVADLTIFTGRRALDVLETEPGPWSGHDPQTVLEEILRHVPDEDPDPVTGARELVLAARGSGTPTAIVTSAGPEWVARSLSSLGLGLDSVDLVVTALDVSAGKPDPEGFALACSRLGADPSAALAAEDAPAGIRAAVAAGIGRVHGITTTHRAEELRAAGAVEVHDDARPLVRLMTAQDPTAQDSAAQGSAD